jgi:hypothetical protein
VEARLAATLLRLADREGVRTKDGRELPFHLTRQSLADMSGTTVETAIRVVSRWLRDEVVKDRGVTGWSCGTGTSCAALRRPQHHDAHGGGRLASRGDAGLVAARGSGFSASSPSTCP